MKRIGLKFAFLPLAALALAHPAWAGDADLKLTTSNGSTKYTIQNSNGVEVSSITSLGDAYFNSLNLLTGLPITSGGTGASTPSSALANLGGQPVDPALTAFAANAVNGLLTQTAANTYTGRTLTAGSVKIGVTNGNGFSGNPAVDLNAAYDRVGTPNQTTTIVGNTAVNNMSFAIGAGEVWSFEFFMHNGCSGTGGLKWAITVPGGSTFEAVAEGMSTTALLRMSSIMVVSGTLSVAFNAANLQTGFTRITGSVVGGGSAGTVQLLVASTTNGQTSTVYASSYMVARRIS